MLDFRAKKKQQSKVPNYLGGREQKRLLMLVGMLTLVAFMMRRADNPRIWSWLYTGVGASEAAANDHGRDAAIRGGDVDTRLRPSSRTAEPLDVIRVEAPKSVASPTPDVRRRLYPGVRPEWLATIRDDTVLRGTEHEALYSLFAVLANADEASLAHASRGSVGYLQLFKQPAE